MVCCLWHFCVFVLRELLLKYSFFFFLLEMMVDDLFLSVHLLLIYLSINLFKYLFGFVLFCFYMHRRLSKGYKKLGKKVCLNAAP